MKQYILITVLIFIKTYSGICQSQVDFRPESVIREIAKTNGEDNVVMKELLADSFHTDRNRFRFYEIEGNKGILKYISIGRINSCRTGGCSIDSNAESGYEYFDYSILFDKNIEVHSVKVFNYYATHGQEITVKRWLKQFVGYDGNRTLRVGKEIDAISGATISANAITFDVVYKTSLLKKIINSTTLQVLAE